MDCTEESFIQVVGGADFRYNSEDCTEDGFIQFGGWEQSSVILRWNVLKTVLYRLVGGAVFRYTALDCTDDCFIQVGGGSILHVYCGGLY